MEDIKEKFNRGVILLDHVRMRRFRIVSKRNEAILLVRNDVCQKIDQFNGFISFRNHTEPSRANVALELRVEQVLAENQKNIFIDFTKLYPNIIGRGNKKACNFWNYLN